MAAKPLKTDDFDYPLDPALISQQPAQRRAESRLMVLDRKARKIAHRQFSELPNLLKSGDLLILNNTRVIPAKFFCRRETGGKIEGLFLHESATGQWEVLLKNAGRCRAGEILNFVKENSVRLLLDENRGEGLWTVTLNPSAPAVELLDRIGTPPLPPYIRREEQAVNNNDRQRYQTVYADQPGAVAAPTAGLHFTEELLAELNAAGIEQTYVTLHVGMGTFLPVKTDAIAEHAMHSEWYDLPAETVERLNAARCEDRRVIAVGTTSVRVLETTAPPTPDEPFKPASGLTNIFIYPPAEFRAVDALITNFHLPRSTLLMLAAAFCSPGGTDGIATVLDAYSEAQREQYRFFSYGDAMLIE